MCTAVRFRAWNPPKFGRLSERHLRKILASRAPWKSHLYETSFQTMTKFAKKLKNFFFSTFASRLICSCRKYDKKKPNSAQKCLIITFLKSIRNARVYSTIDVCSIYEYLTNELSWTMYIFNTFPLVMSDTSSKKNRRRQPQFQKKKKPANFFADLVIVRDRPVEIENKPTCVVSFLFSVSLYHRSAVR